MPAFALTLTFDSRLARHSHCLWLAQPPTAVPPLPRRDAARVLRMPPTQFDRSLAFLGRGRFYPSKVLRGAGPWPARVFRVSDLDADTLEADFNPPLAAEAVLRPGGTLPDAALGLRPETLFDWAGMEAPLAAAPTDFDEPDAFAREDEALDAVFYAAARRVHHVDAACSARLAALYARILPAGGQALDLMAGWESHVPAGHCRVTGLGMNAEEMGENACLSSWQVHDLNAAPAIPLPDASFDAVINSLSIEYLTQPAAVLAEVRRLLRPGGVCAISFSHRYFPAKAIRLWTRLHPLERLGWVLQLMHGAGFRELATWVERGLKRDPGDRYAVALTEMDPLFAVWGRAP